MVLAMLARAPAEKARALASSLAKAGAPWRSKLELQGFAQHVLRAVQRPQLLEDLGVAADGPGAAQLRQLLAGMLAYWARCCREGVGCIKQRSSFFGKTVILFAAGALPLLAAAALGVAPAGNEREGARAGGEQAAAAAATAERALQSEWGAELRAIVEVGRPCAARPRAWLCSCAYAALAATAARQLSV
jgi:hypothetical protein